MRKCRYASSSRIDRLGTFLVYPLAALLVIAADVYFIILFFFGISQFSLDAWMGVVVLIAIIFCISRLASFLVWMCIKSYCLECRMFSISKEGLTLGYGTKKKEFHTWDSISEIAISAFQASASREAYQTVICIFLKQKPDGFVHGILGSFYAFKHMEQFVMIDYSEAIYSELSAVYSGNIQDYRAKQVRCF